MKRHLIIGMGIIALLAGLLFYAAVSAETTSVPAEYGRREDLAVLDCDITIDEATDTVTTRLILENTGMETVGIHYALPLISAGVRPGTLELSASDDAERSSETEVYFSLKPQSSIVFSYSYQTKNSLTNAGAVGMDLTKLIFSEDGRIGRFAVAVSMKEEDLPLIDEIFPVNYRIDGFRIFLELYDFTPSALLNRFYIAKETYRNLKGSRDFEPNEEQQAVLENYRQWFRDGIGVGFPGSEEGGAGRMFAEMIGAEITPGPAYLQRYMEHFSRLEEGNIHFQRIVSYLILREMIRLDAGPELIASFFSWGMTDSMGPAVREHLRQAVYGDALYTVAVGLTRDPALAGVTLHKVQRIPGTDEQFEWVPAQEITLLAAEPYGFYHVKYQEEYSLFRTALIRDTARYSDDELRAYLEAVGADIFARQMLLDDREDQVERNVPGSDWETYSGFFSCPKGGALNAGDLLEAYQLTETNSSPISVSEGEDALAASLPVPAFTHYIGLIYQEEDEARFVDLLGAEGYLSAMAGLPFYRFVADSEKGLALRQAAQGKRAAKAEGIDGRIRTLKALTLREVPFYESGDRAGLYMLAFDMEIWEESDMVTTRLLLENTGGAPVTTCLTLPVLRNGAAEGSLKIVESSGEVSLMAGNRIYFTLPAGGILNLSYRYLTASRLIHAGAVALDLGQLVFAEGGRVGRFSAALTLREEDIPLVTEIFPLNYRFDGRTVSVILYDFAPNRLLNRFSIAKESYRNLMGSRDREPTEAELYVLAHYRKWFREGFPLLEDAVPDDSFYSLLDLVLSPNGENLSYIPSTSVLYPVMLHLCLRTLQTRGQLTKDWVNSYLLNYWDVPSLAPLTRESLRQIAFADEPVLAAVEYAAEPSLAGVPLYAYLSKYKERQNGESEKIREITPVNEGRLLRLESKIQGCFDYLREDLRVMTLPDVSDMPAAELQDTLDALGISLYIRTKLMDNREGAYGTITYSPAVMPEEVRCREGYFSLPQGSLLTRDELGKALLSQSSAELWYENDSLDILIREDPQLAALTIPAFTQYAGIVETEEEMAMVTLMTSCSNPLYSDFGLKDYRAILSSREAAQALAEREAALAAQRNAITEKIEKALNAP